jgi:hypothetical protein
VSSIWGERTGIVLVPAIGVSFLVWLHQKALPSLELANDESSVLPSVQSNPSIQQFDGSSSLGHSTVALVPGLGYVEERFVLSSTL